MPTNSLPEFIKTAAASESQIAAVDRRIEQMKRDESRIIYRGDGKPMRQQRQKQSWFNEPFDWRDWLIISLALLWLIDTCLEAL